MLTRQVEGRVYDYEKCIGGNFQWASDFALGPGGSLYVSQRGFEFFITHGIVKGTLDEEPIWENRGPLFADGKSRFPSSIDLDRDENIYISDDYSDRIFIFDKDGTPLDSWGSQLQGTGEVNGLSGFGIHLYQKKLTGGASGDGELNGPSGLAFDPDDNLYVVDSHNHRVQKFTKDGRFLLKFGSYGSGEGELAFPWGICLDQESNVYVADWRNDRVQKFSPDGKHMASFGRGSGIGPGELNRPSGLAVDHDGDLYVVDWMNDRLNVYDSDTNFITSFSGDAAQLSDHASRRVDVNPDYVKARKRADLSKEVFFRGPVAVNVDDAGRIYVLETFMPRIQIYVKHKDFLDAQFNL